MQAGRLRHRVTITATIELADGHYGFTGQDVVIANRVAAEVSQLTGQTLVQAQQLDPRATLGVLIRSLQGVKAGQAVVYHDDHAGDRTFEIVGPPVELDGRHRDMQLLCKEAA